MNDAERLELPHVITAGEADSFDEVREGGGGYYDRSGNAISFRDWARLRAYAHKNEDKYIRVAADEVDDYWISTVWLGMDHSYGRGPPLIFETMVFNRSYPDRPRLPSDVEVGTDEFNEWLAEYPEYTSCSDLDCERYSSEAQALEGHARMVEKVRLIVEVTRKEGDTDET